MEWIISLINDLVIIVFDIILYIRLTKFKKDNWVSYTIAIVGAVAIVVAYSVATYVYNVPYSIASFLCMTLPSLILFYILSKFKNARFIVTFCFVDTSTLVIAAFSKIATLFGGLTGSIVALVVLIILTVLVLIFIWPYCDKYRELMESVPKGYNSMAITAILVYALLVFAAAYPTPLITRHEDIPAYMLLCVTLISFYVVFILLIQEKSKLIASNELLKQQQHWKELAYIDELTQIGNKTAFDSQVEMILNEELHKETYYLILFDLDSLKYVNDHFGHLNGDKALKDSANILRDLFSVDHYQLFRIGGDEFIGLCKNVGEQEVKDRVLKVNNGKPHSKLGYSCSCGYACIDFNDNEPFIKAMEKADEAMYQAKSLKKAKNQ